MLKTIFIYILKPHLSGIFFIVSAVILIFISWQLYSYVKGKNKKMPLPVVIVSGFTIFMGAESLILSFANNADGKNFVYIFLIKVIMFIAGIVAISLGIFLLKLKKWARSLVLWLTVISGLIDILITLTGADFTFVAAELGIYSVIFTAYYLGLDKKYFKKEHEGFSLYPDAAIKKEKESFFDWLKEEK
ncbi:MAG: hypothetical protein WC412_06795 [Candidatus Omnitrophota bacterium]|jgi:hypothetical protein